MIQDIISGAAVILIGVLIRIVQRSNKKRKEHETEQSKNIQAILAYQETELKPSLSKMKVDLQTTMVDAKCAVYALQKASNGNKFNDYIKEKREELVDKLKLSYRD